jgi:WD40 repeat protein
MASLSQLPNVGGLSIGDRNAKNDGEPDDSVAAFWANAMDHGHEDMITAMKHNFDGTRFLTASSDHRVKVYHKVEGSDDEMVLDDTWTAHDAEVRDVSLAFIQFAGSDSNQTARPTGEDTLRALTLVRLARI